MTDAQMSELVGLVLAGKKEAFEIIYNETIISTYRTLYFLTSSERDAEDIAQNVYLEVYRTLSNFQMNRSLRSWIYGIMIRQFQSHKRKRWREHRKVQKDYALQVHIPITIEESVLDKDHNDEIISKLNALSDKLKHVLVLRYVNDLSQQEIADILEIPLGTVKSRLNQALKRMRQMIGREEHAGAR
ncbi:sigma-70 family RNA polymerase sigma factor [Paenibacillus sp. EC2-1]|uniref:sigma-70 family RNA polymerase sigma factor n=1 Tax=Paenibacillus sp. EC2-1 TaxID=3388665 RepID=UPI003BEF3328